MPQDNSSNVGILPDIQQMLFFLAGHNREEQFVIGDSTRSHALAKDPLSISRIDAPA